MVLKSKKRGLKQYGSGFVKNTKKFLSGLFAEQSKSKRRSLSKTSTDRPVNCASHGVSPTNCYGGKRKSQTTTVSRKKEFYRQSRLFHPDKNSGCQKEATNKSQLLLAKYCVKEEDYHELTSSMKKKRDSEARKQRDAEVAKEKQKAADVVSQINLEFNSNNEFGADDDYNEAKINDNTKRISVLKKAHDKLVKQIKVLLDKNKTLKSNPKFKDNTSFAKKLQKTHKDNIGIARNLRFQAEQLKTEIQSLLDEINAIKSIKNLSDADLEAELQGLVESSAKATSIETKPKYARLNLSQKQNIKLRLKINELKPGFYKGRHVYISGAGVSGVRVEEEDCYVKILESSKGKIRFQLFNSIIKRWEDKNKLFEIDEYGLKISTLKPLSKQESKQFENDDGEDSEGKEAVLNSLRNNSSNNNTFWRKKLRNLPSEQKKSKAVKKSVSQTSKPPPIPSESAPNNSNNLFNVTKAVDLSKIDVSRNEQLKQLINTNKWSSHLESLKRDLNKKKMPTSLSESATPTPKSSLSASLTPTPSSPKSKSLKSKKKTQSISQKARKSKAQSKSRKVKKSKADKLAKREKANKRANNVAANKLASNINIKTSALIETKNLIKSFGIIRNPRGTSDTALKNYIISEYEKNNNFDEIESSGMSQSDLKKVKKALNTLFLNLEDEQYSDVQKQVDKINGLVKSEKITIIKTSKSSSEERLRRRLSENNRVKDIERWSKEANSLKNLLAKPKGKVKSVLERNLAANQRLNSEMRELKRKIRLEEETRLAPKPKLKPKRPTMKLKDSWITQERTQNKKSVNSILERMPKLPNKSFLNREKMTQKQKNSELERYRKYYTKPDSSFLKEKSISAKKLNSVLSKYGGIKEARAQFTSNNNSNSSDDDWVIMGKRKKRNSKKNTKKHKK